MKREPTRHRLRRRPRPPGGRRLAALATATAVLVTATAVAVTWLTDDSMRVTAYFARTVGVYEGADLRILGVTAGRVEDITPEGTRVRVTLAVDEGVEVPAAARAVVVAPSVVSGRFIQLTPPYTEGPLLAEGDVIPVERTLTPMEIDELLSTLTTLSDALGPDGVNEDGALTGLLEAGAENLKGNGKSMGDTIARLGAASRVLDGSSEDVVSTIKNLQKFTAMLKKNDGQVREATRQLGDVAGFLAEDKEDLGSALRELSTALGDVRGFISGHRVQIGENVERLTSLTRTLVEQRRNLADALDTAPLAAGNAVRAYNPQTGTIDGRVNLNELSMGPGTRPLLEPVPQADTGSAPPLPLPAVGELYREAEAKP
ncbi:MCE family protein [Streptomyces sp. TRM 70351]|uniref:MCE family protein n=1 Tax=Streptomyces sp. TRM 70351 TaxID=3116552 RepID=UPI002E7B6494|nr:MCE family protein [Streptomyces sp. TRM 70351]MEE1927048.1 MCE family protein [Streptomyces sp. TRM 70351]